MIQRLTETITIARGRETVNAGFIRTAKGAVVVDTLDGVAEGRRLAEAARSACPQVTAIIYTHEHGDHLLGSGEFPPGGVIVSEGTAPGVARLAGELKSLFAADEAGLSETHRELRTRLAGAEVRLPTLVFERRIRLPWEPDIVVAELGGHTRGSTVVYVPAEKTVFAGDLVFNGGPAWFGEMDAALWQAALRTIEGWDVETVVPGHGPVGGRDILTTQRRWLDSFTRRLEELRAAATPATRATALLVEEFEFTQEYGYSPEFPAYIERALVASFGFLA